MILFWLDDLIKEGKGGKEARDPTARKRWCSRGEREKDIHSPSRDGQVKVLEKVCHGDKLGALST